ncbi:hypothetical protein TNCV_1762781 [Trichonephila clavipes]|nr:hypothetical protein TNCV_1762781 [Trichonephila clavipes]
MPHIWRYRVRMRESGQPVGRLRLTCKNAFSRTIPVRFGRLDTSIATEPILNVHFLIIALIVIHDLHQGGNEASNPLLFMADEIPALDSSHTFHQYTSMIWTLSSVVDVNGLPIFRRHAKMLFPV